MRKKWREGEKKISATTKKKLKQIFRFFVIYHKHLNKNIKLKNIFFSFFFLLLN